MTASVSPSSGGEARGNWLADINSQLPYHLLPEEMGELAANVVEYSEVRAGTGEPIPRNRGGLFSHQRLFSRMWRYSSDRILLIAEPGTGKTVSYFSATESFRRLGVYKRAYIIVKGPTLREEARRDLVCRATPEGVFETAAVNAATTAQAQASVVTREISVFYDIVTYMGFASIVADVYKSGGDKAVVKAFSGCVFVVDEAHALVTATHQADDAASAGATMTPYSAVYKVLNTPGMARTKAVLVTATPMINFPEELGPLMNLILPEEKKFPRKFDFNTASFSEIYTRCAGHVSYVRSDTAVAKAKYIGDEMDIVVKSIGGKDGGAKKKKGDDDDGDDTHRIGLTVYESVMRGSHQLKGYEKYAPTFEVMGDYSSVMAAAADSENAVYRNAIQASLFVFPDGSMGGIPSGVSTLETADAFSLMDTEIAGDSKRAGTYGLGKYVRVKRGYSKTSGMFEFKAEEGMLKQIITPSKSSPNDPYSGLAKFSCKYASIVKIELDALAAGEDGTSFVYSELKVGGGVILLGLCLEAFGMEQFVAATAANPDTADESEMAAVVAGDGINSVKSFCGGRDKETAKNKADTTVSGSLPSKKTRFAVLTPDMTKEQQDEIRRVFNSPENVNGDYIRVLIGSRITRDGINLHHVTRVHLLVPQWTSSGSIQAIARSTRAVSHQALQKFRAEKKKRQTPSGDEDDVIGISIYRHVAVPPPKSRLPSVDKLVYDRSTRKDYFVRRIMYFLKRSCMDCKLNYERNVEYPIARGAIADGTPECDYTTCRYTCGYAAGVTGGSDETSPASYANTFADNTSAFHVSADVIMAICADSDRAVPPSDIIKAVLRAQPRLQGMDVYRAMVKHLTTPSTFIHPVTLKRCYPVLSKATGRGAGKLITLTHDLHNVAMVAASVFPTPIDYSVATASTGKANSFCLRRIFVTIEEGGSKPFAAPAAGSAFSEESAKAFAGAKVYGVIDNSTSVFKIFDRRFKAPTAPSSPAKNKLKSIGRGGDEKEHRGLRRNRQSGGVIGGRTCGTMAISTLAGILLHIDPGLTRSIKELPQTPGGGGGDATKRSAVVSDMVADRVAMDEDVNRLDDEGAKLLYNIVVAKSHGKNVLCALVKKLLTEKGLVGLI